jgi:Dolichyl-phosphate-mannose-protein mannosyltransferase
MHFTDICPLEIQNHRTRTKMSENVAVSGNLAAADQPNGRKEPTRLLHRFDAFDLATVLLTIAITAIALWTFHDYAVSNDEGLQHHYGQLILEYYRSGRTDDTVFGFRDLYLYGGLFDIVSVRLGEIFADVDVYDIRHILCALIGVCGIAATAATARTISGSRAGFIAAVALAVCGAWYGTMFNHTKDVPLAAGMIGATYMLIRIMRRLPSPRLRDVLLFGLLMGCSLGIRVLALLLVCYAGFAVLLALPQPLQGRWRETGKFILRSMLYLSPALIIAYLIMIAAWPWAALAPLNPIRGFLEFAEFQKHIETLLDGHKYAMESVPRLYVPIYILIRVSLITLAGAAIALVFAGVASLARRVGWQSSSRREIALIGLAVVFPLACQVITRGPAFTGLRHFTFVLPPMAVLAGIGIDAMVIALSSWRKPFGYAALAAASLYFTWNASVLVRLHPYEYLYYNPLVGGLAGASRLYATDYWVDIMPEAVAKLEDYLDRSERLGGSPAPHDYTVGVCGERVSFERERYAFERRLKRVRLRWTKNPQWNHADFFIAPTHLNCDRIIDGRVVATISRLGVPIGYVKDRRPMTQAALAPTKAVNASTNPGSSTP